MAESAVSFPHRIDPSRHCVAECRRRVRPVGTNITQVSAHAKTGIAPVVIENILTHLDRKDTSGAARHLPPCQAPPQASLFA